MKPDTLCKVTNRSNGMVSYSIPENRLFREFYAKETKIIPYSEILDLAQKPGGRELIYNYLYVDNVDVITEGLSITPEQEYFMKEEDIDGWMTSCSLDEFKDALDFAPDGVKDLIKAHAVSLPLADMYKCEALKKQLGFDAIAAIQNERATMEDDEPKVPQAERRVKKAEPAATGGRRVTPKYNVVKRGETKEE